MPADHKIVEYLGEYLDATAMGHYYSKHCCALRRTRHGLTYLSDSWGLTLSVINERTLNRYLEPYCLSVG